MIGVERAIDAVAQTPGLAFEAERLRRVTNAAERVHRAVRVKGPVPQYHDAMLARLQAEWPVLFAALQDMMEAIDGEITHADL